MGRMPSFQFYSSDWKADPALAKCSLAARGFWVELIVAMRIGADPTITATAEELARICRCNEKEARNAARELLKTQTADGSESKDGTFTITCRRMGRDLKEQERWRESKRNHGKGGGKPPATFPEDSRDFPGDFPTDSRSFPGTFPALSRPSSASASASVLKPPPSSGAEGAAATAEWAALQAAGVQDEDVLRELVAGGATLAMVEKYRKKTPGLLVKCIRDDLRDAAKAQSGADATAAWLAQRTDDELAELEADAKRGYPADSPFQTNGKIRETRAWRNAVARAMAGANAGGVA